MWRAAIAIVPELTAEKFVVLELSERPGTRLPHRRRRAAPRRLTLEYFGRRDHQVKVRGYRIELGEIETVLAEHPSVQRAAVMVREDTPGDQRIVAYVVPSHPQGGATEVDHSQLLRSRLPEYMVPSQSLY